MDCFCTKCKPYSKCNRVKWNKKTAKNAAVCGCSSTNSANKAHRCCYQLPNSDSTVYASLITHLPLSFTDPRLFVQY